LRQGENEQDEKQASSSHLCNNFMEIIWIFLNFRIYMEISRKMICGACAIGMYQAYFIGRKQGGC